MVAVLVIIDIIILVLWDVLDPVKIVVTHGPERVNVSYFNQVNFKKSLNAIIYFNIILPQKQ